MDKENKTPQLKYAQQHLANERTYLAWIRTAVAMIGIGFLTTSLHFSGNASSPQSNGLMIMLGVSAVFFGMLTIIIATTGYLKKRKQIESQTFYSSQVPIILVSIFLIVIAAIAMIFVLSKW